MGKERKPELYQHGGGRGYALLKYTGFYDFDSLLKDMKSYLKRRGYHINDKQHDEKLSSAGKEITIEWVCSKDVDEYIKYDITLTLIIVGQVDIAINKKKANKGKLEFRLVSKMTKNYSGQDKTPMFTKSKTGEILRHLYEKYIISSKLGDMEDDLGDEANELREIVRRNMIENGND